MEGGYKGSHQNSLPEYTHVIFPGSWPKKSQLLPTWMPSLITVNPAPPTQKDSGEIKWKQDPATHVVSHRSALRCRLPTIQGKFFQSARLWNSTNLQRSTKNFSGKIKRDKRRLQPRAGLMFFTDLPNGKDKGVPCVGKRRRCPSDFGKTLHSNNSGSLEMGTQNTNGCRTLKRRRECERSRRPGHACWRTGDATKCVRLQMRVGATQEASS